MRVTFSNISGIDMTLVKQPWEGYPWSSYWAARSAFYSDGLITDGKLNNLSRGQDGTPLLVESNCLEMAIDDTIDFNDLDGWSIISSGGTAVIEIDNNSVKCTTGGTLYNLILSDGISNHTYPLAEGGATKAYDTFITPVNGIINCVDLTWITQDEYHKNVEGNNYVNVFDVFKQNTFLDGIGYPDGWVAAYATNDVTVVDGIVRVTVPAGGWSTYYYHNISKNNILTIGKSYRVTLHLRRSAPLNMQIRFGTSAAIVAFAVTTEWQTYKIEGVANATYITITGYPSGTPVEGVWFEFDYVNIQEIVDYHYVPKRNDSLLDAAGNSISVIGNGYFIDCETKIKFPDIAIYQNIDSAVNLRFFYDFEGNQRALSYSNLHDNYLRMDRVICQKTDGRLTRMIVVEPLGFTRSKFIVFLSSLGQPTYSLTKITKGAFIFFIFSGGGWAARDVLNERGVSIILDGVAMTHPENWDLLDDATKNYYLEFLINGNHLYCRPPMDYGNINFELYDGEEDDFAAEIAGGDLLVFDVPGDKRGAMAKVDWPDFTTEGTLHNTTKENGGCKLDNEDLLGYSNVVWIPAGQSGVPEEFEEVPLSIAHSDEGDLYYGGWKADDFFGVSFTNTDLINVYLFPSAGGLLSEVGLKCVIQHSLRGFYNKNQDLKITGWLEISNGIMMLYDVASKGTWDGGMMFASSGGAFGTIAATRTLLFNNQNIPRLWCGCFGHHGLGQNDDFDTILGKIETMATNNQIRDSEWEEAWGDAEDKFDTFLAKCDSEGVLVLSPTDFIKNMMFNDYDKNDFWTGG